MKPLDFSYHIHSQNHITSKFPFTIFYLDDQRQWICAVKAQHSLLRIDLLELNAFDAQLTFPNLSGSKSNADHDVIGSLFEDKET